ncbi:MAG: metallophosphoesterase [Gemmatimonadetes bacterium]|nr:metallophosphoesterase [Gemmatimonadota bacterium]
MCPSRLACLLLLCAAPVVAPHAQTVTITGVVFADRNGNGKQDPGEPGVGSVAVTDQRDVVVTDAQGRYTLASAAGTGLVAVSLPDGYRAPARSWQKLPASAASAVVNFALQPGASPREFTFIHASDTHIAEASVPRMRLLKAITDSVKPAFVVVSGDLVRDALRVGEAEARGYYDLYVRELAGFTVPVWSVPGNHENFGVERSKSGVSASHPLYGKGMFRSYLGPTYFGFTWGGVHFLGLDSVDIDDESYYGHVDDTQLAWIEKELATVRPGTPVVTFQHIPLVSGTLMGAGIDETSVAPSLITVKGKRLYRHVTSNTTEVLARLTKAHPLAIALGGHYHAREAVTFDYGGTQLRFQQSSAVVGPAPQMGKMARSGVMLYRVSDGVVDAGTFIPLDPPGAAATEH